MHISKTYLSPNAKTSPLRLEKEYELIYLYVIYYFINKSFKWHGRQYLWFCVFAAIFGGFNSKTVFAVVLLSRSAIYEFKNEISLNSKYWLMRHFFIKKCINLQVRFFWSREFQSAIHTVHSYAHYLVTDDSKILSR